MKNKIRILAVALSLLLLVGCGKQTGTGSNSAEQTESEEQSVEAILDISQMFTERDYKTDYDESSSTTITLKNDTAQCDSDAVEISGSTITVSDEGTYIISGTLDNGMLIVNAENTDKIQLVLDNATINSNTSAAIYVAQADKVFVTLAENSENTLSNGGKFTAIDDNNIDAAVFSKDDLTLNGSGSLTVTSPAGHGVVSKDDLVVTGGEYSITSSGQGLCGKESVRIADGNFKITAEKDGIHAEDADDTSLGFVYLAAGTYNITAEGDGVSASNKLQIDNGDFTVETGGGSETVTVGSDGDWGWARPGGQQQNDTTEETVSAKGFKASGDFLVNDGTFNVDSADDALHSNASLTVNGGTWNIASGDDGLHSDETTAVANGTITITKSYEGIEGQNISVSGGEIDLTASDDGLNAAGGNDQSGSGGFGGFQEGQFDTASESAINISGGTLHINASGDGVDSNGSLFVSGGETYVSGPTNDGNGILDYSGEAKISGGIFIAAGSSGMAQSFGTNSTQGVMTVSASGSASDNIELTDSSGKKLLSFTADKAFSCIIISSPEIEEGGTYTVTAGNSSQSVTMDSLIYGSGSMGGGSADGMSGRPGNRDEMSPRP